MSVTTAQPDAGVAPATAGPVSCNIARRLTDIAERLSDRPAVVVARRRGRWGGGGYTSWSFAELEERSNACAAGLAEAGIERGMRVLMMVRPGLDFVALTFAVFKIGALPVLIDAGLGVRRMVECVAGVAPQALIGIPAGHVLSLLRPAAFRTIGPRVTVGRRFGWRGPTLAELVHGQNSRCTPAETRPDEPAAILFTSGATGAPKGVVFTHGIFDAQVRQIQALYGLQAGEVHLATFPLFALFGPGMGMTCVIPDMDASHPGRADPLKIISAIQDHGAASSFGSPALWDRVSTYCAAAGRTLSPLKRILIAGAPVSWRLLERLRQVLPPDAEVHTPYGATEALPVATITGREVLRGCVERSARGAGTCVGRPVPDIRVRFIRVSDEPIEAWSDGLEVPRGQIGEIVVAGEVVTRTYYGRPEATRAAKIHDGPEVWHRMGDVGYLDDDGRIWFCGRKAHRVETRQGPLYSVASEGVFNAHPAVRRCALVRVGRQGEARPAVVVEPLPGQYPSRRAAEVLRRQLSALASVQEVTRPVRDFLFRRALPVDVRHNAKIDREALAAWAVKRLPKK
ncbi:MAG TPA: fatty acid CoA ligase family protein [Phycisphaerae bacterium]|nr:fatty acid CoA ligase family protein [Phycisphaerae bacterium]HNU45972.1 fatty acid CoA ligase family protein [Phycisphaerae bacterium]